MSTLTKVLERNIKVIEKNEDLTEGRFRLGHHLMPPVGWLNDPNGLCWYKGRYHVFFQYAPFDVEGGLKFWGHYTSEDLVDWKYEGTALYPDSPYDCHGVYSGSALAESEKLHLFFTGNIKIDGDYDYINEGRETSTLHVESEDGIHFGDKEEIISFEKYPEEFTCHIRDPKVWKENDKYFMVLGGRLKGDKGAVLVYESENLKEWKFKHIITTPEAFGYMWECPDYFELDGKKFLTGLLTIDCLNSQCFCLICDLCTGNAFDTFDSLFADSLDIQFSFTSNTNDISFLTVYTMLFDQLIKAVCITWF